MKAAIQFCYVFIFLLTAACHQGTSPTYTGKNKILALIIASDDQPVYLENQKIWRSYMKRDPEHIEAYFIKSDPTLSTDHKVDGDSIWFKTTLGYIPTSSGILDNTILALDLFKDRLNEFSFVLRPNISSFYAFDRLLRDSENFSKEKFYAGVKGNDSGITFASGSGYLLSIDLAKLLIDNKSTLIGDKSLVDDVVVGKFLTSKGINVTEYPRMDFSSIDDWNSKKDKIPANVAHFRVKNSDAALRLRDDVLILTGLRDMFYPQK
jgi:hypothetical protein